MATVAGIPLKVTVLAGPWESPKLYPEIMTDVPTDPSEGHMEVITGFA